MKTKIKNEGIYRALIDQLDKLARHNRQGSFRTKDQYYEAMKRFCKFLADHYRLQKLANISGKHLVSYVEHMQMAGKAASTIKTDLAAIRFFHDLMDTKRRLPGNDELGIQLERRRFGQKDHTWTPPEFNRLLMVALAEDRYDYILAFYLARYAGLRVHECFRIDTAIAEDALRRGASPSRARAARSARCPSMNRSPSLCGSSFIAPNEATSSWCLTVCPLTTPFTASRSSCWITERSCGMRATSGL